MTKLDASLARNSAAAGNLLRLAETAQQMLRAERLPTRLKAAVALQCPLRFRPSGGKGVDPNVLCGVIDRHDLGDLDQRAFRRTIRGASRAADSAEL